MPGKCIILFFAIILLSACNRYKDQIEKTVAFDESIKGNVVHSCNIISQKDSSQYLVVTYSAVLDSGRTSSGAIVFSKTGDGTLSEVSHR